MTAPSIARFRGGSPLGYSPGSGPSSRLAVMSWEEWTGSGSRQMRRWVKLVWGGCNWPQPDRPRQAGDQAQYPRRGQWWATEHRGGRANVHDTKLLEATLRSVVVERPRPSEDRPQHLCLDKGYDNPTGHQAASGNDYQPHIRRIGEEKLDASGRKRYPARRWVIEQMFSWLSKCRGILVRYEKKSENYLAMLQLACALISYRCWYRLRF